MKPLWIFLLLPVLALGQESKQEQRLKAFLSTFPEADANEDGVLTMDEVRVFRSQQMVRSRQDQNPEPRSPMPRMSQEAMEAVYEAREFEGLPYRLLRPIDLESDSDRVYPLILSLHGAGGKGQDNKKNLKAWNGVLAQEALRRKHPCFVVAPQSAGPWRVAGSVPELTPAHIQEFPKVWQNAMAARPMFSEKAPEGKLGTVFELLNALMEEFPIDPKRIYVLGHSMGGFGTFEAIAMEPERFAAAIPSAGGLSPWLDAERFQHVPIWAFHGDQDRTVPVGLTQVVFDRVKALQGNMKFTVLGGVGHGASGFAFIYTGDDMHEGFVTHRSSEQCDPTADVWDWLFAQARE